MSYTIAGLARAQFDPLFALPPDALAPRLARRMVADADRGFPCRISLEDARAGEDVLLLHYTSHDVATPHRTSYAIYVRADAAAPARFVDRTPLVFAGRALSLRGFSAHGDMVDARLANAATRDDADADRTIRDLFGNPAIAYIHAHFAAFGCFAARIDRHGKDAL